MASITPDIEALADHGIGFMLETAIRSSLENGSLTRVPDDWCQPFDGYHLYFPANRQASPAFRLLVNALRFRDH